jgi:hypothetical protein
MAQSAVSAIRTGCNMLSEGRADLEKFKKGTEQAVADAKAIYKEVTGLLGWVKRLFGGEGTKSVAKQVNDINVVDTTKSIQKKRVPPEKELTYEEYKAKSVHEIFENLKVYFETIRQLKAHCLELEAESSTTEHVADNALDLIEIRWQLNEMSTQVREAMSWTPEKLGLQDLFKQFLQTYDEIQEQQEFARQIERKKEREARWQRELSREIRIYKTAYAVAVLLAVLEVMGLYSALQENFGFGSWLLRLFFSH